MKVRKDESGQAAVLIATFLGLLALGFIALAVDMGYFFHEKRMVQAAADAAAMAAAEESTSDSANMLGAAQAVAKLNGFDSGAATNPATVTVHSPPTTGNYAGDSSYTEAIVSMPVPTLMLGAFNHGMTAITVAARAVATSGSTPSCIMGLSTAGYLTSSAPNYGYPGVDSSVSVAGGASLTSSNCGVCGNGASGYGVSAEGGGTITAYSINSPGGDYAANGGTINATNGVTQGGCSDPYAGKLTAPTSGACIDPAWMKNNTAGGAAESITAGTYCNFNTSNVSTLTLGAGTYIITQNFSTNSGSTINGTGVTFYFANGAKVGSNSTNAVGGGADGVENGATLNLTAPTSGNLSGILFWDGNSSSSTPDTFTFGGGSGSTLTGAIYAPNSDLQFGNGTNTGTFSGLIVGYTVMIQGGSTVTDSATASTMASLGMGGAGKVTE
ncbi:MAG: pilus assembly protein TadG-related protein [Terracidiphilus sp.]|jgi:Flp pilus assembly protein TadG